MPKAASTKGISSCKSSKILFSFSWLEFGKRTTNEMFLPWNCNSGQIFLAKNLWTFAGHQLWHSLGLGFSGGCYCGTNSAYSEEDRPWARGRALLLLGLISCSKSWASTEGLLATWSKRTFLSAQSGNPGTCMQLPKDKPKEEGTKWKDCNAGFTALSEYISLLGATEGCLERLSEPNHLI